MISYARKKCFIYKILFYSFRNNLTKGLRIYNIPGKGSKIKTEKYKFFDLKERS
jgi:hypothetical protein